MESGGDEKRIQALFSELSFADQSLVPPFGHVWSRAQAKKEIGAGSIFRPVAVSISILVTACSLVVWTWYWSTQSSLPNIAIQLPQSTEALYTPKPVKLQQVKVELRRQKQIERRRPLDRSLAIEAALLSSWQSPTQQFMASPTVSGFSSLPQLNQSVKDLESFLLKNSEIMKESNR